MTDPFEQTIEWRRTPDAEFPYEAEVGGVTWRIRVNDWPDNPTVYTLLLGDRALDFNDWPKGWTRPD